MPFGLLYNARPVWTRKIVRVRAATYSGITLESSHSVRSILSQGCLGVTATSQLVEIYGSESSDYGEAFDDDTS